VSVGVGYVLMTAVTVAAAPTYDFIVPTGNYDHPCQTNAYVCQTDNATVYYYMDSVGEYELEPVDKDIVRNMINQEYGTRTTLTIVYDNTPVFSGAGETDVVYQEGSTNVPAGKDGATWCNDPVDTALYRCDQAYVQMRGGGVIKRGLSCHETGHAVGLVHGDQASPRIYTTDNEYQNLACQRNVAYDPDGLSTIGINNINYVY
jgi:hypothetical protein